MKNLLLAAIILFPVSLFAGTYDDMAEQLMKKVPAKDKTKIIAVMPFSSDKEFESDAKIASEEMTKAMIEAGANVSERSQIDKMLKEQELQQVGVLTNENAGEVGQGLGAKYVVLGTVTKIDKYGESGNIGLKINVRLVTSSNYKVIAAASGEGAAGDASAKYKRKAPRKPVEYPQFLELFGGATKFKYDGGYDNTLGTVSGDLSGKLKPGLSLGARLIAESSGFFTFGLEFLYTAQMFDNNETLKRMDTYQLSAIPVVRLPLWVYIPSLPDYTSIHLGYAFGLGVNKVFYTDGTEKKNSKGFGICSSAILGFRMGITESVSFFVDGRFAPATMNQFIGRTQRIGGKGYSITEEVIGPSVYFGISLAP